MFADLREYNATCNSFPCAGNVDHGRVLLTITVTINFKNNKDVSMRCMRQGNIFMSYKRY